MGNTIFGELLRRLRLERDYSLREFCKAHGFDLVYISRIERGMEAPPVEEKRLAALARAVGLKTGAAEWRDFMRCAKLTATSFSEPDLTDQETLRRLPVILCGRAGDKISARELKGLAESVKSL